MRRRGERKEERGERREGGRGRGKGERRGGKKKRRVYLGVVDIRGEPSCECKILDRQSW